MLVSYNWLQTYFKKPLLGKALPTPEKLAELFTFHSFEVEGIEEKTLASGAKDIVLDVKILPDRAHYALSHHGIAYEAGAILGLDSAPACKEIMDLKAPEEKTGGAANVGATRKLDIKIAEPSLCARYIGRVIEGVTVGDSPVWLRDRLEAIGQRSINTIVDIANFVMFDSGQPLHAFDADKVKGTITVRLTKAGEKMTTLGGKEDGKEIELRPDMLVIADDEGVLALAGVKGGSKAEITRATKNIIIEAAQFNGSSIRKTSTAVGIRNDSSKRFENEITPELASKAMESISRLIFSINPEARLGTPVDVYPKPATRQTIDVSVKFISHLLGVTLTKSEVIYYLKRLKIEVTEGEKKDQFSVLHLTIPFDRLDLVLLEDIVEEIGRLYGYDKIPEKAPQKSEQSSAQTANILKSYYYAQKVRAILSGLGFSEIYTPSLVSKGEIDIQNPLASDKRALRSNLSENLVKSLELNMHNAPLLGLDQVKVFEIGATFGKDFSEHTSLAVGTAQVKGYKGEKINEQIRQTREALLAAIDSIAVNSVTTLCTVDDTGGIIALAGKQIGVINNIDGVMELDLGALVAKLPEPTAWDISMTPEAVSGEFAKKYSPISAYPFVLRDVAVFVPEGVGESDVRSVITSKGGALLTQTRLFDIFTKKFPDGSAKTSYAFSLVFQSHEKTLSDDEINAIMKDIYDTMTKKGWQIR